MKASKSIILVAVVFAAVLLLSTDVHGVLAGTLLFKSSWETPVDFTGSAREYFKGSDKGFTWSNFKHEINYIGGILGTEVDSRFSTSYHHTGTRSLYQVVLKKASGKSYRNQLVFYASDSNPQKGWLSGPNIYVSKWVYFPSSMKLPLHGWMCLGSYRELRSPSPDFSIPLYIYMDYGAMYWYIQGILYSGSGTRLWKAENHDVPVPLGRWFHLETYVERRTTGGVVKVWVDGKLVFNLSNVRTKYDHSNFAVMVAKMYVGSENYGYSYPYYQYVDDLEIWKGLPS